MQTQAGNTQRIRRGVIGVLCDGARMLVVQRGAAVSRPGCWCFPGGHLEPGETAARAVVRELREELGIAVATRRRMGSIRLPDAGYVLAVWRVDHVGGTIAPAPGEIAQVCWMTADEVRHVHPGLASNELVLTMLGM